MRVVFCSTHYQSAAERGCVGFFTLSTFPFMLNLYSSNCETFPHFDLRGKKREERHQWSPASSIKPSHRLVLGARGENDESVDRTDPHWHHDIMITGCSGRNQWVTSSHQPLAHWDQEADPWRFRTWFGFGGRTWGFEHMWQLPYS